MEIQENEEWEDVKGEEITEEAEGEESESEGEHKRREKYDPFAGMTKHERKKFVKEQNRLKR